MIYFLRYSLLTGIVDSIRKTSVDPIPDPPPEFGHFQVTELDYLSVYQSLNHPRGGGPRWKYEAGSIVEIPDSRIKFSVSFSSNPVAINDPFNATISTENSAYSGPCIVTLVGDTTRCLRVAIFNGSRTLTLALPTSGEYRVDQGPGSFTSDVPKLIVVEDI